LPVNPNRYRIRPSRPSDFSGPGRAGFRFSGDNACRFIPHTVTECRPEKKKHYLCGRIPALQA
jgi:hypothetical protein